LIVNKETAMVWRALDWACQINGTQGVLDIANAMGIEEYMYCTGCEGHYPHLEPFGCVMCGQHNVPVGRDRQVLMNWTKLSQDARHTLLDQAMEIGDDGLFNKLGGNDGDIGYYAFLYLIKYCDATGDLTSKDIDTAYTIAEAWSKWDLSHKEITERMSGYDSFDYFMENESHEENQQNN
jgi:hypothetical protein